MANRDLTQAFIDETKATHKKPTLALELHFSQGIERHHIGQGQLMFDSDGDNVAEVFEGTGKFLGLSSITETREIKANSVEVTLSGVPSDLLDIAQNSEHKYRDAKIWILFVDDQGNVVDDYQIYGGQMDVLSIKDKGDEGLISVSLEHEFVEFLTPNVSRYTDEAQKNLFPNDDGLEYIGTVQDKDGSWGKGV